MSKNLLVKVIELVNDIICYDDAEVKDQGEALSYLNSLKVTVPHYVADWFEDNTKGSLNNWVMYFEKVKTPEKVAEWLNSQEDFFMTLAKMEQFGYFVEGE